MNLKAKILPEYLDLILAGKKRYEMRGYPATCSFCGKGYPSPPQVIIVERVVYKERPKRKTKKVKGA